MTAEANALERLLMRDRAVVVVALTVVVLSSWLYLMSGAGMGMSAIAMTSWRMALGFSQSIAVPIEWDLNYALVMFAMWWVMMIAMMLPSATPIILLHTKVDRQSRMRSGDAPSLLPTALFTLGYLAAWAGFSALATGLQWGFEKIGVLSPMMMNATNQVFAGLVLLFAGLWQFSPIKQACLRHCRGPIQYLSQNWRPGASGAFVMGLTHGAYCLGCCWGLMVILFFGGIMNLYWIILLAVLVLIEKLLPIGPRSSYVTGALLALWGLSFVARALA